MLPQNVVFTLKLQIYIYINKQITIWFRPDTDLDRNIF